MASKGSHPVRPSAAELAAAAAKAVPDIISEGLSVVFCGINPSLYSAAVGHHFARPGNRFWPALHRGGFTTSTWSPYDDACLLEVGVGITNLVARASARADELSRAELAEGAEKLREKLRRYRPAFLAVLGIGAFKIAFGKPCRPGPQPEALEGSRLFVLPNPSGLQAQYQLPALSACFAELREAAGLPSRDDSPASPE